MDDTLLLRREPRQCAVRLHRRGYVKIGANLRNTFERPNGSGEVATTLQSPPVDPIDAMLSGGT